VFLSVSKRQSRTARIRWHSFAKSHRAGVSDSGLVSAMSAGQLAVLHRLAMLTVTATLDKYSPTHRAAGRSASSVQQYHHHQFAVARLVNIDLLSIADRVSTDTCLVCARRC